MAAQCCRGLAKGVKGSLLPTPGCPRRTRRLCLQRPVESLQSSVLLRVTRFDPLGHDTQLDPPYRQMRQATQAHAAKGRSVVGPNNSWESILSKGALKDPMRFAAVGSLQLIADQQVARSGVLRRQRVDPGPISRAEPTLEVNGPHVIGALRCSKRLASGRRMASTFPTSHQPCSVQDVPGRAGRRPRALRLRRTQPRHHLLRSPVWVGPSYLDQPLGYCQWRPIRATTRSSAPVSKSLPAIPLEPILTLLPRLAAYPKLPT